MEDLDEQGPVELPIDGALDLHTFNPREIRQLLPHYLAECRMQGLLQVRIIHGKGTGALRETVRSILKKLPEVESVRPAGEEAGGWGASIVILKPAGDEAQCPERHRKTFLL